MQTNDAVVETLVAHDIETVFGIPGNQSLPLNQAIRDHTGVRYVMARHETAVSHQAWGYAESTGNPAATLVVPGPGDINAMNGLRNALNDCTPLVHLAVETNPRFRGGDAVHETPPSTYDTVVKNNITVETPQATTAKLTEGITAATTPPKGPVRIGIPKDFLTKDIPLTEPTKTPFSSDNEPPADRISETVDLLTEASRPVIIAGGGIRTAQASDAMTAVADQLAAPVIPTYKGKGTFPEDHELFAGILCVGSSEHLRACLAEADLALCVGTDLDVVTTQGWSVELPDTLIHITLHAEDIGRHYPASVGLVADANAVLTALNEALPDQAPPARNGIERAQRVRDKDADLMADPLSVADPPLTSASAQAALREAAPRDTIVSVDAGGFRIWSLLVFAAYHPRSFIDTGSWASMGTGLPAAIGAKVANPDTPVLCLTGDGGLLMCAQELHTAAREGIPVVTIVFNNADYATISANAADSYGFPDKAFAWEDGPVDFETLAEAVGVRAERAETPTAIRNTLPKALAADEPVLIEIPTDPLEPQAKPLD